LLLGCSGGEPAHPTTTPQQTAKLPPPPPPPEASTSPTAAPAAQAPPASQPADKPANAGSHVAKVGSGKKLSRLSHSLIAAEFATLYAVRERMVFEAQIPKAMQIFKATEGRAPKSHEEFMEKIIKDGQINLPELSDGERYRYDPKTEELWVDPAPE
jgi:hypothetical protein